MALLILYLYFEDGLGKERGGEKKGGSDRLIVLTPSVVIRDMAGDPRNRRGSRGRKGGRKGGKKESIFFAMVGGLRKGGQKRESILCQFSLIKAVIRYGCEGTDLTEKKKKGKKGE